MESSHKLYINQIFCEIVGKADIHMIKMNSFSKLQRYLY